MQLGVGGILQTKQKNKIWCAHKLLLNVARQEASVHCKTVCFQCSHLIQEQLKDTSKGTLLTTLEAN